MEFADSTPKYRPSNESRDVCIEEKHLAGAKRPAAFPGRQRSAEGVAFARYGDSSSVDHDDACEAADCLAVKRRDVLQKRYAERKIATQRREARKRFGRRNGNQLTDM